MRKYIKVAMATILILLSMNILVIQVAAEEESDNNTRTAKLHEIKQFSELSYTLPEKIKRFGFDSGLTFNYPEDGVKGMYVTGNSAGGSRFETLLNLTESTDLNAMVIDVKEDHGYLTFKVDDDSPYASISKNYMSNPRIRSTRRKRNLSNCSCGCI